MTTHPLKRSLAAMLAVSLAAPLAPAPVAAAAPTQEPPPSRPAPGDPRTVRVQPGDSFWVIAERLTSRRLGRPATDAEVLGPWSALIDANRDQLVRPDDPGLLLPGQVLHVPDPP